MLRSMSKIGRGYAYARSLCSQAASQDTNIFGAAILERLPVVTPAVPEWEIQHQMWLESFRADPRKTYPPQFTGVNRSGTTESDTSSMWQPASRVTAADDSHDTKSLQRRLDQRLVLLLKVQGSQGDLSWQLPAANHQMSESIRESAERAISSLLPNNNLRTFTLGNAPAATYSKHGSRDVLFYVKMQLIEGQIAPEFSSEARWQDYAWVASDELLQYFEHDEPQGELLQALM